MNESDVLALLEKNECEYLDFKEQLVLTGKDQKSELSKDVSSIANSVNECGWLIIGIRDNKEVIGIKTKLNEEQIIQTCSRRITPPVQINVYNIVCKKKLLGVIKVSPIKKPHKISQDSGVIKKEDVYLRRGSVIEKASPEDIFKMMGGERSIPGLLVLPRIKIKQMGGGGSTEERQYTFQVDNHGGDLYASSIQVGAEMKHEFGRFRCDSNITIQYNVTGHGNPSPLKVLIKGVDGNGQIFEQIINLTYTIRGYSECIIQPV